MVKPRSKDRQITQEWQMLWKILIRSSESVENSLSREVLRSTKKLKKTAQLSVLALSKSSVKKSQNRKNDPQNLVDDWENFLKMFHNGPIRKVIMIKVIFEDFYNFLPAVGHTGWTQISEPSNPPKIRRFHAFSTFSLRKWGRNRTSI